MEYPSFEQFAETVRSHTHLKRDKHIGPETQLQRDLGVTADEGTDLLEDLEQHYGIQFAADSFDLKDNECLFHSQCADESPFIQTLFGTSRTAVRPLTVGQLCRAVLKEIGSPTRR